MTDTGGGAPSDGAAPSGPRPSIAVVGSANVDLSIPVESIPRPGETVLGGDAVRGGGGKGANQAVAAARLGADVSFVGRVGDDDGGRYLRQRMGDDGIGLTHLLTTDDTPTGLALIAVDREGENSIVVSPGANRRLGIGDLVAADAVVSRAAVVLTQLEIPPEVVAALPARAGGLVVLNPAPARSDLSVAGFDVVVPNRGELALLAGAPASSVDGPLDRDELVDQARSLDVPVVVVTLGGDGALVVIGDRTPSARLSTGGADVVTVPAQPVTASDTTAAGDSFCGALAVALAEGADVVAATRWAVAAAAITVTRVGAQASLPWRHQVGPWETDDAGPSGGS